MTWIQTQGVLKGKNSGQKSAAFRKGLDLLACVKCVKLKCVKC